MHDTLPKLLKTDFPVVSRHSLDTLQVNITLRCNQQCVHCHVNASPRRNEFMDDLTIELVLKLLKARNFKTLDITGGAPELHPQFCYLVEHASRQGVHVIDRCNLTILLEDGYEEIATFLSRHQVEIIASLPCYLEDNVDRQRGQGIFKKSITALQRLNALGYGREEKLKLNLVYNPQGAVLPPSQEELENSYKKILWDQYQIKFNQLFTLCNMPIKRFGSTLISNHQFDEYQSLLKNAYQAANLNHVMCRTMLSIDWQGYVYDCDFNQMLGLAIREGKNKLHMRDLLDLNTKATSIIVGDHCYGCTAGQGSSCGGALS